MNGSNWSQLNTTFSRNRCTRRQFTQRCTNGTSGRIRFEFSSSIQNHELPQQGLTISMNTVKHF